MPAVQYHTNASQDGDFVHRKASCGSCASIQGKKKTVLQCGTLFTGIYVRSTSIDVSYMEFQPKIITVLLWELVQIIAVNLNTTYVCMTESP